MTIFLNALCTWLHTLATIVMVGYFLFLGLVYLPVMERKLHGGELRDFLVALSKQLQPYFGGALLVFIVTGTYLMMTNSNYLGLGHFFANGWSALIVLKHFVVVAFLALAVVGERVYQGKISAEHPEVLQRYKVSLFADLALGMLILLMTAVAQTL